MSSREHAGTRSSKPRLTLRGHTGWVDACAISADAAIIASAGEDIAVRIWDGHTGELLWTLGPVETVSSASASAHVPGDSVDTMLADVVRSLGYGTGSRAVGLSADGHYAAQVSDEFLTVWNLERSAEWDSSIREQLACVSWPGSPESNFEEGWVQACWIDETAALLKVWFALSGNHVASADFELDDGVLVEMGKCLSGMRHIAFRPDGGALVTVASAQSVAVTRFPEGIPGGPAGCIALTAHDRSAGLDGKGLVFSVGGTHGIVGQGAVASVFSTGIYTASSELSPIPLDGQIVACSVARDCPIGVIACTGSRCAPVCVWDLKGRSMIRPVFTEDVTDCALSADGSVLVTTCNGRYSRGGSGGSVVQVWDV